MAVFFRSHDVSDLCLGKPALTWLPITATIADVLSALRTSATAADDTHVTIWSCDHSSFLLNSEKEVCCDGESECRCLGKICMVDVICYLSRDENLLRPASALRSPAVELLSELRSGVVVRHVSPELSLFQALDLIAEGAQNLVIPRSIVTGATYGGGSTPKKLLRKLPSADTTTSIATNHDGKEFCWVTQEDVVRFILSFIGLFSPLSAASLESLGIIRKDFLSIRYDEPASSAREHIRRALDRQMSVAVVDNGNLLVGDLSPFTLMLCDETMALALATLSAGELMAYIDCGGPPGSMVKAVRARVRAKTKRESVDDFFFEDSSDEEFSLSVGAGSPTGPLKSPGFELSSRHLHAKRRSSARKAEAVFCRPSSSLIAVIIQALAHRVNCVWVVTEDFTLVGIVTFADILRVIRDFILHEESAAAAAAPLA